MRNYTSSANRRGEVNPTILIVGGIVAAVVVGIVIAFAVHHHRKEVARTSGQAHIAACKELQSQITQEKAPLSSAGLKFQPYQGRFDAAAQKQKEAEAVIDRDPQQGDKLAAEAETGFKSVLGDLQLAVQVKTDTSGGKALQSAETRVAQTRKQNVAWNFPGSPASRSESYRLDEAGQNPDTHMGAARRLLGLIDTSLEAGQPQEAARILQEAKSEAASAERCIEITLDSKLSVESKMAEIKQKCEPSDAQFAAAVEKAYFNQEFVAAATRMVSLQNMISDRQETRELLTFCQRLSRDVATTLDDNSEYSSESTDEKFHSLKLQLSSLADAVKQTSANWSDLKASAQRLEKGLNEVRDEAVQAHKNYDEAVLAVKTFRRDYEQADRNGTPPLTFWSQNSHPDITDPVKDKVKDVNSLLSRVERQVKLSKQDWRQIRIDAEAGSTLLADLRVMVEEDNKKLDDLLQQKALLKEVTTSSRYSCTVNGKTYTAVDVNRRDGDFSSHWDNATDRFDVAMRAWRVRERVGFDDALRSCTQEVRTLNNIGWYNMLHMMRNSPDQVAQQAAWDNGFRDGKSRADWETGFVSKRAAGANGLWVPDLKNATGGSADFGPAPDFNADLPN